VFCSHRPKQNVCAEQNIYPEIWIDDCPELIVPPCQECSPRGKAAAKQAASQLQIERREHDETKRIAWLAYYTLKSMPDVDEDTLREIHGHLDRDALSNEEYAKLLGQLSFKQMMRQPA
jgi:hypothetical protein